MPELIQTPNFELDTMESCNEIPEGFFKRWKGATENGKRNYTKLNCQAFTDLLTQAGLYPERVIATDYGPYTVGPWLNDEPTKVLSFCGKFHYPERCPKELGRGWSVNTHSGKLVFHFCHSNGWTAAGAFCEILATLKSIR